MADDNSSRLLEMSEAFRTCSLVKNASRNLIGKSEYMVGSPDTISDGDCRGRDPKDPTSASSSIGTNLDISSRISQLAKNGSLYTAAKPYGEGNC